MEAILTDQDLDHFIWQCIKDSTNPLDFVDYLNFSYCTYAKQEEAYEKLQQFWGSKDSSRCFEKVVATVINLAEGGNLLAMFHLGRWYRLGYCVEKNEALGIDWYKKGAAAGCTKCLIYLARHVALSDEHEAVSLFRQASDMGDSYAHCFWADFDKPNYEEHLLKGASSQEPYAKYSYAHHLFTQSESDSIKTSALDELKVAAEKGESSACTFLAYRYLYGSSVNDIDLEQAKYWAKKGARLGDALACVSYARILVNDRKTEDEAVLYMRRSAMLGNEPGQTLLGVHLMYYGKTPELQAEGLTWLKVAANAGHKPAMEHLATALKTGKGGETNPKQAIEWLQKGASLGNADCQAELGSAYMSGEFIEQDQVKAHNLFHLASLQGNSWGTYLLGVSYQNGHGVEKDHELAFACFMEAANKKVTRALYKVATAYMWGEGVQEDIPAGAKWLKQAAQAGDSEAQAYLGMMFLDGMGVEENVQLALHWLKMAAKQDNNLALRELGFLYEAGKGVTYSRDEAKRLISKAASLGDQKAIDWLDTNCPEKPKWLKDLCLSAGSVA